MQCPYPIIYSVHYSLMVVGTTLLILLAVLCFLLTVEWHRRSKPLTHSSCGGWGIYKKFHEPRSSNDAKRWIWIDGAQFSCFFDFIWWPFIDLHLELIEKVLSVWNRADSNKYVWNRSADSIRLFLTMVILSKLHPQSYHIFQFGKRLPCNFWEKGQNFKAHWIRYPNKYCQILKTLIHLPNNTYFSLILFHFWKRNSFRIRKNSIPCKKKISRYSIYIMDW